jgi:hypothetical protein
VSFDLPRSAGPLGTHSFQAEGTCVLLASRHLNTRQEHASAGWLFKLPPTRRAGRPCEASTLSPAAPSRRPRDEVGDRLPRHRALRNGGPLRPGPRPTQAEPACRRGLRFRRVGAAGRTSGREGRTKRGSRVDVRVRPVLMTALIAITGEGISLALQGAHWGRRRSTATCRRGGFCPTTSGWTGRCATP